MKINFFCFALSVFFSAFTAQAQRENPIMKFLPQGTVLHGNVPYNNDTLKKHLLDIYLPVEAKGKVPSGGVPLVVLIHGGGWIGNDKYADMGYMPNTVAAMLNTGMAVASIDYRFAMNAVFPAILQDCNKAVSFLYDNAAQYGLDKNRIALMGFSAGGHLASLMGTSHNNKVKNLYSPGSYRPFKYKAVVDFYGPTDLTLLPGNEDVKSPEGILIGAKPLERPDLAKAASPITYIDKNDPPFLIYHGEKDNIVSNKQSKLFSAWLNHFGVKNELTIVKDAPHFGKMYDVDEIKNKVIAFLKEELK
ncbi:alpha/beta hydrolase [Runella slithyformis]|uniref:Lipase/esterase n=1 Tax=Runella slithyformis (strain ATCC 29530 / DSM 19594 / LMG 11500 / NCIMB 11436 / LSU 4) TaxID=761193 RepID=A0A7U4E448_RUNSL|nr:alpha/beta hydrolase [Runella slithyformis]AEI46914.1 putative lipase/esterase [Runella slithyformis DSM 19594]